MGSPAFGGEATTPDSNATAAHGKPPGPGPGLSQGCRRYERPPYPISLLMYAKSSSSFARVGNSADAFAQPPRKSSMSSQPS